MMFRKSLWFGLLLTIISTALLLGSVDAKSKKKKRQLERISAPPTISLSAEPTVIRNCADDSRVRLLATASSPSGRPLRYKWTTNGGRLSSHDPRTTWDLAGAQPGVYQVFVEVDDGSDLSCVAFSSVAVVVNGCPPVAPPPPVCPNVTVTCPDSATENAPVTFTANVSGGPPYGVRLPFRGVDPVFDNEEHGLPFVDYLRLSVRWAGFPRLERCGDREDVKKFIERMTKDVEPF